MTYKNFWGPLAEIKKFGSNAKTQMDKLTLQDYIDLEELIKSGAGEIEQQSFLLSRFYELDIDIIKKIDIRFTKLMTNEMNDYINKKEISQKEMDNEVNMINEIINKDYNDDNGHDEQNSIEDRFRIMDL